MLSILGSAKVAVALLVLGVPIIDTFWIIVGRLTQGGSPFTPDRSHIHHRLLDLGLSHRDTVLVIYAICAVLGVLSLLVSAMTQAYAFISVFILSGPAPLRPDARGVRPARGARCGVVRAGSSRRTGTTTRREAGDATHGADSARRREHVNEETIGRTAA